MDAIIPQPNLRDILYRGSLCYQGEYRFMKQRQFFHDFIFDCINQYQLAHVLGSLLEEKSVLVHSKDLKKLTGFIVTLKEMLEPFQWQHIFIPVLPNMLNDVLEAPCPFFIGTPNEFFHSFVANPTVKDSFMAIDLDAKKIHCVTNGKAVGMEQFVQVPEIDFYTEHKYLAGDI
jgi:hypothetical protein